MDKCRELCSNVNEENLAMTGERAKEKLPTTRNAARSATIPFIAGSFVPTAVAFIAREAMKRMKASAQASFGNAFSLEPQGTCSSTIPCMDCESRSFREGALLFWYLRTGH